MLNIMAFSPTNTMLLHTYLDELPERLSLNTHYYYYFSFAEAEYIEALMDLYSLCQEATC